MAGALGVPPEVFRQAFSGVHPAPAGVQPTGDEQRSNKAVLLSALAPYGITNERLDEVSNHYRYQRSMGQMWPIRPAAAYAVMEGNRIVRYVVTRGGYGYTSEPTITVPGFPNVSATAALAFSKDFARNGAVASIKPSTHYVLQQRQQNLILAPGSLPPPPPPPPPLPAR